MKSCYTSDGLQLYWALRFYYLGGCPAAKAQASQEGFKTHRNQKSEDYKMKVWYRLLLVLCLFCGLGYAYWKFAIPTHRITVSSELVMLGGLNGDSRWTATDMATLDTTLKNLFAAPKSIILRIDMNQNGMIDEEDLSILRSLVVANGDPYIAEEKARLENKFFPRPRELYRYVSVAEYRTRPFWALPYSPAKDSVLDWLAGLHPPVSTSSYKEALYAAVYDEAVRFDQA
jgi:hypothetical protein